MTTDLQAVRRVDVGLGERSYPIVIGRGLIAAAGRLIAADLAGARALIVTDAIVAPLHLAALTRSLEDGGNPAQTFAVAAGAATQSFAALQTVVDAILEARLERGDLVVALGGGGGGDHPGVAPAVTPRGQPVGEVAAARRAPGA
jgi:3-dehydroquinate synthase